MGRILKDISSLVWDTGDLTSLSDLRKTLDKIEAEHGPEALICLTAERETVRARVAVKK